MSEAEKAKSEKTVGALVAGLKVLRYMSRMGEPVGVSRVAKDLSISPSTCFSLLRTLVHENLLSFHEQAKTYSVSSGLLELTRGALERDLPLRFVKEKMSRVTSDHRVTTMLFKVLDHRRVILVDRVDADVALRVHISVGQRLPMYIGALGRCFAGFGEIDRESLYKRFKELRWESPPSFEEFISDAEGAKGLGFAVDRDNFTNGITTAAAPILDADKRPVAVVSAIGFSGQLGDDTLVALGEALRDCTAEASEWF